MMPLIFPRQPQAAPPTSTAPGAVGQGVPTTREELQVLFQHRSELRDQLARINTRRIELANRRRGVSGAEGRDFDRLIAEMDARSIQLDRDILRADEAFAAATARGVGQEQAPAVRGPDGPGPQATTSADPRVIRAVRDAASDAVGETLLGIGFAVLGGIVLWRGFRRFVWKRKPRPALDQARLEQLQQSVDVVALEVERISEAQRFLAKALNDKLQLGAGPAEPVSVKEKEGASLAR
jgi:hypothetical protein